MKNKPFILTLLCLAVALFHPPSSSARDNAAFEMGQYKVKAGTRQRLELPAGKMYNHQELHLSMDVIHSQQPGPVLCVTAAVHGDEINGVEIISRLLTHDVLRNLRGTLVAIPVVNMQAFLGRSRYFPDRRDLNRSFPGSEKGSGASRLARLLTTTVLPRCSHVIDLHTGAVHRSNLPQIRADLSQAGITELAGAFGAPVIVHSNTIKGSFRASAQKRNIPLLLYEGGQALRFEETPIQAGVGGILGVMRYLNMLPRDNTAPPPVTIARSSYWVRAPQGGLLKSSLELGQYVDKGQKLADISDTFGENLKPVYAGQAGLIIGINHLPFVEEGSALFHIAETERP